MENVEIAGVLEDVAVLLQIEGANPFRIRAYQHAARTVEEHTTPLRLLVQEDADLTELPGIGKDLAASIRELVTTGRLALLDELSARIPYSLVELTRRISSTPRPASWWLMTRFFLVGPSPMPWKKPILERSALRIPTWPSDSRLRSRMT